MMATRWGCLGTGRVAWDFFYAIKDNLPAQDHEVGTLVLHRCYLVTRVTRRFILAVSYSNVKVRISLNFVRCQYVSFMITQ